MISGRTSRDNNIEGERNIQSKQYLLNLNGEILRRLDNCLNAIGGVLVTQ